MLRKLAYLFVFLSVIITVSHNVVPHQHHEIEAAHHDHDDDDGNDDHGFFSFGQLDDTYIHSDEHTQIDKTNVSTLCVQPEFSFDLKAYSNKLEFEIIEIYPPPDNLYFYSHSLRGPPVS